MKIDRLETHDRLQHLQKDQAGNLAQGVQDCLKTNTLSLALQEHSPYIYIFAHPRTADDGITKRMIWQPRISRPAPQTNSYLFRAVSKSDILEICWMIPPREMWGQFGEGKVTENEIVNWSIHQFQHNRKQLEANHPDDLPEEFQKSVYRKIVSDRASERMIKKLYV